MYRGFDIKVDFNLDDFYLNKGKETHILNKIEIKKKFNKYFIENGSLNGNLIMDEWFPTVKSDIFLSHSHKDEDLALSIAGYLKYHHELDVFVDSSVWGNCNDLLKSIDDKYCLNTSTNLYDYHSRNYSTSHVHMMLMNSLNKMIDTSEALFFLNTPNSVLPKNVIGNKTFSPWIYSEIETSKTINKKTPNRLVPQTRYFSATEGRFIQLNESMNKELRVNYNLELGHLTKINSNYFKKWLTDKYIDKFEALNNLYNNHTTRNISYKF